MTTVDNETEPARGNAVHIDDPITVEDVLGVLHRMRADRNQAHEVSAARGRIIDDLTRELRYARGGGTFADACALLMGEALDGEGVVDTVRRLIAADDARGSALTSIAIALGLPAGTSPAEIADAAIGAQTAAVTEGERRIDALERELDEARRDAAAWKLQADTLGEAIEAALGDACTGDLAADVRRAVRERFAASEERDEAQGALEAIADELDAAIARGPDDEPAVLDRVRHLIASVAESDRFIHEEIEAALGLDCDPGAIPDAIQGLKRERNEARAAAEQRQRELTEALATLRARCAPVDADAIRAAIDALGSSAADVDARNRGRDALHRLAAGQPSGVVLSAEDAAVVRAVLDVVDEDVCTGRLGHMPVVRAWTEWRNAGRPLASKEGA